GDGRIEEGAAVARALVDGHRLNLLELRLQLGQTQLERLARAAAANLDDVGVRVDRSRNAGIVIADEEGVVRRQEPVIEDIERCLELRRARGDDDQRPLLREGHDAPFAPGEWLLEHRLGHRRAAEGAEAGSGTEAGSEKAAACRRLRGQGHDLILLSSWISWTGSTARPCASIHFPLTADYFERKA